MSLLEMDTKHKKKMIETCQAILESCDKPFVWEEEDYKKPFNLLFPHPQIEEELNKLLEKFSGCTYLYDQIEVTCTLEAEWFETGTYGLDRNINMYFKRYSLKPEFVTEVKTYFNKRLAELQNL